MAERQEREGNREAWEREEAGPLPVMQEVLDNTWFLFLVSGVVVLVSYIIWALVDLLNVPVAP